MTAAIRPARTGDWPRLEPLLRDMGFTEGQPSDALRDRLLLVLARDDHTVVVAEEDDQLVGYAWAQDHGRHLRSGHVTVRMNDLFVDPRWRRRGVGRALFQGVCEWSRSRGARWLQWQGGHGSTAFYAALGLQPSPDDTDVHPFYEIDFRS